MIQVYNTFNEMPTSIRFMFKKLYGDDVVNYEGFAVSDSHQELYDFSKIIGHSGYTEHNTEDFSFEEAPEFYLVIKEG